MMKKYEKIYQKLSKKYTDQEIAESMLIPADLTPEEEKELHAEMREFRFKLLRERTEEQRIYSDLARLRILMDRYLKEENYSEEKSFGQYLEEYARILKKTKKSLAEDLGIHSTRLSRIINNKEEPNIELTYRLEKHSGKLVPALVLWKLIVKKQEFFIHQNQELRKTEAAKVKNAFSLSA